LYHDLKQLANSTRFKKINDVIKVLSDDVIEVSVKVKKVSKIKDILCRGFSAPGKVFVGL